MIDSLYIGATGMQAQQLNIDIVANNLANVNTAGFKRNRIDFEDLVYRRMGAARATGTESAEPLRAGMGTSIAASGKVFLVGEMKKTDQSLDLAIRGHGFFEIAMHDGSFAYTRHGAFQLSGDGMLVTHDGHRLSGMIQIPADTTGIRVDTEGRVFASVPGERSAIEIGQIELVSFVNASGLSPIGDNLYGATEASGEALRGIPGQNGVGTVAQGYLEASNVRLIDEMINLIMAQRAYEINAKVVQASDEMLSISNSLYR